MIGSALHALDGNIGHADDLLFDDKTWTLRYVVVKTGGLLNRKRVLISPLGVAKVEWANHALDLNLTQSQIEASPDVDTDKPVFREMESRYFDYFGWPYYWTDASIWGIDSRNPLIAGNRTSDRSTETDSHLRSCRAVSGYAVEAEDTRFGHVEDFLFEEGTWTIRYLLVDTKNWLPSKPVLISPKWVHSIDWNGQSIRVDLTKKAIEESPRLEPASPLKRSYEEKLHHHYHRPQYWHGEDPSRRK